MDFTMGMNCPICKKHGNFHGGNFGGSIESVHFGCACGFQALLVIADKKYSHYEIKGMPVEKPKE